MDSSTREILKRTLSITETHVESDKSGVIEEKWGDVSVNYKGYAKYDVVIEQDTSNNIDKETLRHTHLYLADNIQDEIRSLNEYYIKNNLGPYAYAFSGPDEKDLPVIDICDGETGVDNVEAIYLERDNKKYYSLNINKSGAESPKVILLTRTTSKAILSPNDIVENECKIILSDSGMPEILKSVNLNFEKDREESGVQYYHISGSIKSDNAEYVIDDILPLVAMEENGTPINVSDIDIYEPTEEEQQLINDILDALINGTSEGETRFDVSTKGSTTTITINEGTELTNITLPEDLGQTIKINGEIKSGTIITYNTPGKKSLYVTNTAAEPADITLESTGTIYLSGEYDDIQLNAPSLNATGSNYANVHGNIIISDDIEKSINIQANFIGEPNNIVSSNAEQPITITARNENSNIILDCPNSTVTLGGASYNEIEANVADDTLKLTINTHINKLHLKNGNIFINNGKNIINDLVNEVICDYEYSVDYNKATVLPSNLSSGCEYTLSEDKNGSVACTILASGDTVINLNGHNINGNTTRTAALYVRSSAHIDIHGEGNITNELAYCVWGADNTIINIYGGRFTGETHTIYSYKGNINIYGGEFILLAGDIDENGHWKFLLNCYDANYTAGTAIIKVYGGKYYNFDPANAYGEPGAPISYVAEGYKSVCVDEENQIYEVIPENE